MAQNSVSSPWAHPIGTSGTPVAKPGSSGICIFRPWSSQGHRTTLLALLPGIPAPFPHSHDRLHPVSEYAKAPSSPGLATVEDGVQSLREERVLIWPVSGITMCTPVLSQLWSGQWSPTPERKPEAHEYVGAHTQCTGPLALIILSTFCWCLQASHAVSACAEVGPVHCMCTPMHSSTPSPCHLPPSTHHPSLNRPGWLRL